MDRIIVRRSGPLEGAVHINGAKNSVLKLMAATVLAPGTYRLHNVPAITDVHIMADVLRAMDLTVTDLGGGELEMVRPSEITPEQSATAGLQGAAVSKDRARRKRLRALERRSTDVIGPVTPD